MIPRLVALGWPIPWSAPAPRSRRIRIGAMFVGAALSSVASAQLRSPVPSAELGQIRCSASAPAPLVRIEGTSELIGDIAITCENRGQGRGFEPSGFLVVDLAVSLSVGIANHSGFGLGADVTDAVLVVNEKTCLASTSERLFSDCGANGTVQDPMLARRGSASPGLLLWSGVALPHPRSGHRQRVRAGGPVRRLCRSIRSAGRVSPDHHEPAADQYPGERRRGRRRQRCKVRGDSNRGSRIHVVGRGQRCLRGGNSARRARSAGGLCPGALRCKRGACVRRARRSVRSVSSRVSPLLSRRALGSQRDRVGPDGRMTIIQPLPARLPGRARRA